MVKTVIVVLNWNNYESTIRCVDSLRMSVLKQGRSIIVVDNNSSDDSVENFRCHLNLRPLPPRPLNFDDIDQQMFILSSPLNCGYAGGNNFAINMLLSAGCDFDAVWILNNDTLVNNDALTPMELSLAACKKGGFVGSVLLNENDLNIQCVGGVRGISPIGFFWSSKDSSGFNKNDSSIGVKLSFITGASMLISRRLIDDVGLMNDFYFLYYEEMDWQLRARKKGYDIRVAMDSVLQHAESGSVGAKSEFFFFVFSRSCVIFVARNYNSFLACLSLTWLVLNCFVSTRKVSKIKSCFRGAWHGLTRSELDLNDEMFRKVGASIVPH